MPRREERAAELEEERRRHREEAEAEVASAAWDRDPIKQYVRRFGWLEVIRDYLERREREGVVGPWKYLTLPGANASDIGMLAQEGLLVRTGNGFPHVAICDNTSAEKVVANLGGVLAYSTQSFQRAVAWPRGDLCDRFPFDVINLDLTGPVITTSTARDRALRRLVGIRWTFRLQRCQSFLLLLTASADDEGARGRLERVLADNLDEEEPFKKAYAAAHGSLDAEPYRTDLRRLSQLVIPKVIARMAKDCGYKVTEHFVAKYDRPSHRMLCHSFEFEFLGRRSAKKKYEPYFDEPLLDEMSRQLPSPTQIRAVNAHADFLATLPGREARDVGEILLGDPTLSDDLLQQAVSLVGWTEARP